MEIEKLNEIVSELSQEEVLKIIKVEDNSDYLYLWYLLIYGQLEECCELFSGKLKHIFDLNLILNILKCLDRFQNFEKYKKIFLDHVVQDMRSMTDNQKKIYKEVKEKFYSEKKCSVVVACMNREKNLIESLPSWFNNEYINEIILVDYSSQEKLSENKTIQKWVDQGYVNLITVQEEEYFSLGKAYNLGFDFASGDFIIKIDADYMLKDDSFLDNFLTSPRVSEYFIRGDYNFGMSMSGFFLISRQHIIPYREDLNGYGYDEIDLYNRILTQNPSMKEIVFFDIEKYIYHIPHNNKARVGNYITKNTVEAERLNRNLCEIKSFTIPNRLGYERKGNNFQFKPQTLDKIFCISLKDKKDRRKCFANLDFVDVIDAVDTRRNRNCYLDFGLSYSPVNQTHNLYFQQSNGAFGAYLSHFLLWKHIVANNIKHSLILEDDVDIDSVISLLNSNIIFEPFDLVNLSHRTRWNVNRTMFDGAESYILSREGAEKLLRATYLPRTLNDVIPECYYNMNQLSKSGKIRDVVDWASYPSITCPLDKFIGYCCESKANDMIRLNSNLYPFVKLNTSLAINSDINDSSKTPPWELSPDKMLKCIS